MITFRVNAVPLAMPRPHATSFAGRAQVYNPTKRKNSDGQWVSNGIREFKASVREAAEAVYKGRPLRGPLFLRIVFVLPRPQVMRWKTKAMPRVRHSVKPDLDNLEKTVKDSLKGVTWIDDSQVASVKKSKWIAAGNEQPHVEIEIKPLTDVAPTIKEGEPCLFSADGKANVS